MADIEKRAKRRRKVEVAKWRGTEEEIKNVGGKRFAWGDAVKVAGEAVSRAKEAVKGEVGLIRRRFKKEEDPEARKKRLKKESDAAVEKMLGDARKNIEKKVR
jgi:hypothetical protein